jgi:glycerophosphoryl diester phosphodiesterase
MYEEFPQLAREKVDIVIGCSHQRTDTHQALEIINRFLSYHVNAYLVRSSVSLGEDSPIGGCSCVIAPNGDGLVDMKSKAGYETVEFDHTQKYYKKAGYRGTAVKPHYEYVDDGRRPWLYRNGGASVIRTDNDMPYPRLCAHRGFNTVAPENSMPAFGAAVALGAQEIEFDLRTTKDGVLVSIHDYLLDRVSDGEGNIEWYTFDELQKFDFGVKFGEKFKGLRIIKFEDILQKFAGRVIMNIHVKLWENPKFDWKIKEIVDLVHQYDCEKYVYFMGVMDGIKAMKEYAPHLKCCMSAAPDHWKIVDRAIEVGAEKVQLFKPDFNKEMIDKAHAHGIKCNVFWSDDPEEAAKFLEMGVDCVLTNDYLAIKTALEEKGLL